MKGRIMLLQLGAHERVEIVTVEVGLGTLRKVLLVVGGTVVPHCPTCIQEHPLVALLFHRFPVGVNHRRVIKAEHLIVVGVRQFVENHGGMLDELPSGDQGLCLRNVHLLDEPRVVPVAAQPPDTGMILHRTKGRVLVFDPNLTLLQSSERIALDEKGNPVEVIREHAQALRTGLGMLSLQERGVDIFRMKGFISFAGESDRFVFQGVHMLFDGQPDRPWGDQPRRNQLVFIGRNLDEKGMREGFERCLV